MTLTKDNFCNEADRILSGERLLEHSSPKFAVFLDFLISELDGLPFDGQLGEPVFMRDDAREIAYTLAKYLTNQSRRIKSKKGWRKDLRAVSKIYEFRYYEVFKNIIHPNTGLEGTCYSVDLSVSIRSDGDRPLGFVLDRYFVKSRKKDALVYRRGSIELFYDGKLKIFTNQDKWS